MSKKNDQKKSLKRSFNAVIRAFDKQKNKELRALMAERLETEFKDVRGQLKNKIGTADTQVVTGTSENGANASPEIKPSPAVVEEMRVAVMAS